MNKAAKKFIKLEPFIKEYCPDVTNIKHKLRGVDGNKKPIDFSETEKAEINKGLKKFAKDIIK